MANAINSLNFGGSTYTFTLPYGVCSTAADTAAKIVTVDNFSLETGATVIVKFTNANSIASPTLNVNGTGAKSIMRYGTTTASTGTTTTGWVAGAVQMFTYDGTNWIRDYWNNTTYSNAGLGQGYATCSTAADTPAKVGSLSSYSLTAGGIVSVKFTYAVPASATLNINSKGAKSIYYRGAAITADVIKAGDIATFIYSSQYHLISIDRWQEDITAHRSDPVKHITSTERTNWNTAHAHSQASHAPSDAEANQNAFSNITVGSTTIAADNKTDTLTLVAGSNVTITPDATNDKITIAATDTTYTFNGAISTIKDSNLTTNRALVSDSSGKVAVSAVTSTELGYLDGVTSAIQTQLDGKAASSHGTHVSYGTSASTVGTTASAGSASTVSRSDHVHLLPTASSTLGGVKTTSTVTSTSGLTACPIISGIPYYKDTNTTTSAASGDTSSKIFLIGRTSQSASGGTTYSHDTAFVGTNGHLYSNSTQVVNLSDSQALTNKTYNGYTLASACAAEVSTVAEVKTYLGIS